MACMLLYIFVESNKVCSVQFSTECILKSVITVEVRLRVC